MAPAKAPVLRQPYRTMVLTDSLPCQTTLTKHNVESDGATGGKAGRALQQHGRFGSSTPQPPDQGQFPPAAAHNYANDNSSDSLVNGWNRSTKQGRHDVVLGLGPGANTGPCPLRAAMFENEDGKKVALGSFANESGWNQLCVGRKLYLPADFRDASLQTRQSIKKYMAGLAGLPADSFVMPFVKETMRLIKKSCGTAEQDGFQIVLKF